MATYYAIHTGGNWSAGATWSTISAKDASRVGGSTAPTNADDCIIDDYSGNVTVNTSTCVAKTLDCTGHTGTLTFTASQTLSIYGSCTFSSGMTVSGTGTLAIVAAGTLTTNGKGTGILLSIGGTGTVSLNTNGTTWAGLLHDPKGGQTWNLLSNFQSDYISISNYADITVTGAYNITTGTFTISGYCALAFTYTAGQTLTVTSAIKIGTTIPGTNCSLIKSGTPGSPAYLVYSGTAANCLVSCRFTDIDASGSSVPILCSPPESLSNTVNIYCFHSNSFPVVADVKDDVEYGGADDASANRLTGTYAGGGGSSPRFGDMTGGLK